MSEKNGVKGVSRLSDEIRLDPMDLSGLLEAGTDSEGVIIARPQDSSTGDAMRILGRERMEDK